MKNVPNSQPGFTLVELIITITIIAVIAAIAMPAFSSGNDKQLDFAAGEFAAAIRFARREAIRTGNPHGFHEQSSNNRIRVFRLDTGTSPATAVYDVYHPVTKSLYDIDLDLQSLASADLVDRTSLYRGICNQVDLVFFDHRGTSWCNDPPTVGLESYDMNFYRGARQITVTLDGITGRVTVQ